MHSLGIDFGTSNSACGVRLNGRAHLIEVEPGAKTMPTAVFFDATTRATLFGSAANRALTGGAEGRYMRALKSVLGTPLMRERRMLGGQSVDLIDIVAQFLTRLKSHAEAACHVAFGRALSGRPVHFHPDPDRDARALADLAEAYARAGFTEVAFMPEPEAAALANGALAPGTLGLIVDIGGGTSDFTLFTGSQGGISVLASHGVRIGGTGFDREISLGHAMPLLGHDAPLRNAFGPGVLPAPNALFRDLASWEKIAFLYAPQTLREVRAMGRQAVDPVPFARLASVLEHQTGHDVAFAVERAKIEANAGSGRIDLGMVERGLSVGLSGAQVSEALAVQGAAIRDAAIETCALGGIACDRVGTVVFVGGSSLMGIVVAAMRDIFPGAEQRRSDPFTGVVDGLALASGESFS